MVTNYTYFYFKKIRSLEAKQCNIIGDIFGEPNKFKDCKVLINCIIYGGVRISPASQKYLYLSGTMDLKEFLI